MVTQGNKEMALLKKRLLELANTTFYKEYATFSDFLNLNEQSIFYEIIQQLPDVSYMLWGGTELAERKMICFYKGQILIEEFPISILKVIPSNIKFSDNLTHRDYLGAILNLGIERSKIGDILLSDKTAYVFVNTNMKEYIASSLEKVKHTNVKCVEAEMDFQFEQKFKEIYGSVSSIRLDAVIALAFQASRSSLLGMISGGKVFVNGRMITSNSCRLNEGDVVSVRGKGKFIYYREKDLTKKGKIKIVLRTYV